MSILLEVKSVSYSPPSGILQSDKAGAEIIRNVSFAINKGSITGLAGQSGSGKTTLAKLITGIIEPTSGEVIFNTSPAADKNKISPVQILFQNNGEIINPYRRIADAVKDMHTARYGKRTDVIDEIKKIMSFVDIPESVYNKKGFQLSGGEQQRAALAKLIASRPELMVLDEPFSAQDPGSRMNLVNLFKKINSEYDITMLCISHNIKLLKELCSHLMIMYKGEIVEQGNCEAIFSSPSHPYTKYLLKAENYNLKYDELKQIPVE